MKLQRQSAGQVAGKEYHKFVVVLPNDKIKLLEWSEGDELEVHKSADKLVLSRVQDR